MDTARTKGVDMPKLLGAVLVALIGLGWPPSGWTEGSSQREMRSLDEQVQEIKTDVLDIAAELSLLEERLLFPSNTQLSVFVSLAEENSFRLDAVQIHIDGQLAAQLLRSVRGDLREGPLHLGHHALLEAHILGQLHDGSAVEGGARVPLHQGNQRVQGLLDGLGGPGVFQGCLARLGLLPAQQAQGDAADRAGGASRRLRTLVGRGGGRLRNQRLPGDHPAVLYPRRYRGWHRVQS